MAVLGRRQGARAARRVAAEEQILQATHELLAGGESFANLSVEHITSRAGISRTAFYDYFRDKRDLLIRLVERAVAPTLREADQLLGGRPSGPGEIPFTIQAAMDFARDNTEVFCAVVEAATYDEVVEEFWRGRLLDRFIQAIERRIRRQQSAGAALPVHAGAAAAALVLMVTEALYRHVRQADGVSDKKMVETLVAICVRAVYGPVDKLANRNSQLGARA